MSSLLRTSRYLFPQLKLLISPTNPLLKISISTISTTNNVREEKSQAGPPPIQVGITETAGRAVFATRKIGASELIHTAKPIISHPSLTKIGSVCYLCLKRLKPEAGTENNSRIRVEPFCTEECRQQAKVILPLFL